MSRVVFVRGVDPDLHLRIRLQAAAQDVSITEYALRALRFVVEWDEDEENRRRAVAISQVEQLEKASTTKAGDSA